MSPCELVIYKDIFGNECNKTRLSLCGTNGETRVRGTGGGLDEEVVITSFVLSILRTRLLTSCTFSWLLMIGMNVL